MKKLGPLSRWLLLLSVAAITVFSNPLLASSPMSTEGAWSIGSGEWSDPTIWSGGMVPDENTRTLISQGTHVTMTGEGTSVVKALVVHGVFEVTDSGSGSHRELITDWIHVNALSNQVGGIPGGALFRIGSEDDRFRFDTFTLTLAGTNIGDKLVEMPREANPGEPSGLNNRALMTVMDNDGFLMTARGGRLEMYGQDKISFTKLAETAEAGQTEILVENVIERNFSDGASDENGFITSADDDGELNWTVGDKIVVTSTDYDYMQFSRATISDIIDMGDGTSVLALDQPLSYRHFGEIETYQVPNPEGGFMEKPLDMRAEVALLSRNIVIQGLAEQDTDIEPGDRALAEFMPRQHTPFTALDPEVQDTQVANGIGGHIMIMGSPVRDNVIDGVQLNLMGQASRRGRYPIHWHIAGDRGANPDQNRSGDLLRNTVVTNSNNRGVVLHGTSGVRVEGVTLFDVHGHGFFLEDAVEVDNEFIANLAIAIHTVGGEDGPFPNNNIFNSCAGSLPCRLSDPVLVEAFQNMNRGLDDNGNPRQPRNDPFIVDTHDLFQVFESRGAGSAAFWITNPDNRFIGNISAGAFGTGFWYILPRMPIGESAHIMANTDWSDEDSLSAAQLYLRNFLKTEETPDGYSPNELPTVFDYNTSHSAPTGFTIFRGEDIEGGAVDPDYISPEGKTMEELGLTPNNAAAGMYRAAARTNNQNLTFTGYRGWKARGAATYILYNGNLVFEDAQIADSMMGIFAPRVRARNSLLVGDSRGNADHSLPVSLMTFYDRWNAIDGSHVAGLEREEAHLYMFDKQLVSAQISDYVKDLTFEDDGSRDSISIGFGYSGPHWVPHSWSRSILDIDGSLTGHVGGGPGTVLVPDIPFMVGNPPEFTKPQGWGVYITPITHARLNILVPRENFAGNNPDRNWSITSPEGVHYKVFRGVGFNTPGHGQLQGTQFNIRSRQEQPLNETYAIDFSEADSRDGKIVIMMDMDQDDVPRPESDFLGATVLQITGAGSRVPSIGEQTASEIDLRHASDTAYFWDADQEALWLKVFVEENPVIELVQAEAPPTYVVTTTAVNGTITSQVDPGALDGQTISVTGQADPNHYFVSVSGCGGTPQNNTDQSVESFSYETGPISGNCTVEAVFAAWTYSVSAQVEGAGSVDVLTPVVDHGDSVDFEVSPDAGWTLRTFEGDSCMPVDNGNGTWTATDITADCTVQAIFVEDTTMVLATSASPAIAGVEVIYTISVSGSASAPADGSVTLSSDIDGTLCAIDSAESSNGNGATFTCAHTWTEAGSHTLTATFSDSGTHVDVNGTLPQVISADEFIFHDRFGAP